MADALDLSGNLSPEEAQGFGISEKAPWFHGVDVPGIAKGAIHGIGKIFSPRIEGMMRSNQEFSGPPDKSQSSGELPADKNQEASAGKLPSGGESGQPTFANRAISGISKETGDQGQAVPLPRSDPRKQPFENTTGLYNQAGAPAPGAPPQAKSFFPDGSMLDRVFKGDFHPPNSLSYTLMALGAGLAGAPSLGTGLGRGLSNAVPAMRMDVAQGNQNQTAAVLQRAGIPGDIARVVAMNPQLAGSAIGQMQGITPPQHIMIKDSLGNERPYIWSAQQHTFVPMALGGAGGGVGDIGAVAQMPIQIDPSTGRDEAYLHALEQADPVGFATVQGILAGNVNAAGRNMQKYLPYAARAEGGQGADFAMQRFQQKQKAWNDWYGGGKGDIRNQSLDQALMHGEHLAAGIDKHPNFGGVATPLNVPYNAAEKVFGQEGTRSIQTTAHALADELAGLWKQNNLSDTEIRQWDQAFPVNGSVPQQKAAIANLMGLAEGGFTAMENRRQRDLGPSAANLPPVMSPEMRARFERIKAWANAPSTGAAGGRQQAPQQAQQAQDLPHPKSREEARKLPPGTRFVDPAGNVLTR